MKDILVERYGCRDAEGGCGAARGEQCKTFARGKPTQPHADRWTQWNLDGSPGAWWNEPDVHEPQPPIGSREDLLSGIERSLKLIGENVTELRRLGDGQA